jgi:hypothetical protein
MQCIGVYIINSTLDMYFFSTLKTTEIYNTIKQNFLGMQNQICDEIDNVNQSIPHLPPSSFYTPIKGIRNLGVPLGSIFSTSYFL